MAVAGVENENVGSAPISTVANETVGRNAIVGNRATVNVGAKVDVAGM
jgi:hypothetical protein